MNESPSKWKCPECGSTKVQIALPAWHHEKQDGAVAHIETDTAADILWWFCEGCGEARSGEPELNEMEES